MLVILIPPTMNIAPARLIYNAYLTALEMASDRGFNTTEANRNETELMKLFGHHYIEPYIFDTAHRRLILVLFNPKTRFNSEKFGFILKQVQELQSSEITETQVVIVINNDRTNSVAKKIAAINEDATAASLREESATYFQLFS